MLLTLCIVAIILVLLGLPISFSLATSSFLVLLIDGKVPLNLIPQLIFTSSNSFILIAIPLFILAGALMETGGISARLIRLAQVLVGHVRGGLGMTVVIAEIFFSGISGSTAADVSAIGAFLIPALKKGGYTSGQAVSIVSAASAMGILVPPCIMMVVLGGQSNLSIGALFAAGFIPSFILASCLLILIYVQARRSGQLRQTRASLGTMGQAFLSALIPLGMPIILFGAILTGITTPTEAAVLAVIYALVVGVGVYREIKVRDLPRIFLQSAVGTANVMWLIAAASVFGYILNREGVPVAMRDLLTGLAVGPALFLLISNLLFIVFGAVLEGLPALIILMPIFLPVATSLNINPIHYSITVIAAIGIGLFLPPIGVGIYIACNIAKCSLEEPIKPIIPYIAVLVGGLLIITYVPWFTTIIPDLLFSK